MPRSGGRLESHALLGAEMIIAVARHAQHAEMADTIPSTLIMSKDIVLWMTQYNAQINAMELGSPYMKSAIYNALGTFIKAITNLIPHLPQSLVSLSIHHSLRTLRSPLRDLNLLACYAPAFLTKQAPTWRARLLRPGSCSRVSLRLVAFIFFPSNVLLSGFSQRGRQHAQAVRSRRQNGAATLSQAPLPCPARRAAAQLSGRRRHHLVLHLSCHT
nr:hypothetical protein CFP56_13317 [Quercus suber]